MRPKKNIWTYIDAIYICVCKNEKGSNLYQKKNMMWIKKHTGVKKSNGIK